MHLFAAGLNVLATVLILSSLMAGVWALNALLRPWVHIAQGPPAWAAMCFVLGLILKQSGFDDHDHDASRPPRRHNHFKDAVNASVPAPAHAG